ncbi:DOMON domain-containing protein [Phthorimaea operculella]|nr:DOMON domain-containing protein [Phthorimaea operculella]
MQCKSSNKVINACGGGKGLVAERGFLLQSRNRALLAGGSIDSTGGDTRTSSRAKLVALPATTYRPPQLRAGPAALAAHSQQQQHEAALRRRADSPASQHVANQQLLQPQYQDQRTAQQNQQNQQQTHQQQFRQHQYQPVQFFQQPQPFQLQPLQHQLTYQELLFQQQLLQEQRRLYEQQLYQLQQQRQYLQSQQQSGPLQYHLLPQDFRQQRDAKSGDKDEATGEKERASEVTIQRSSKLNCEVLYDELAFEVRWAVAGDSIVLQLVAKLEDGEYMSFGVSGDSAHSQMVGGDVAVAWVDKQTLKGYAHDYYLDAKSQCAGVRGSCPDERLGEKTNSIRLLNAALVNGYSIVTYQRSLKAADELDRAVLTNASQPVIWALGPLNSRQEVSYHHHFTKGDRFIEFGRAPLWNCPMPEGEDEPRTTTTPAPPAPRAPPQRHVSEEAEPSADRRVIKPNPVPTPKPVARTQAWEIPGIQCYEPPDGVFYAQMGPTGGKQGYPAITGHVGWGISWYINGLLIPEITVVRGKKYTFVVEGGIDPDTPAKYHPFYITNDPVGGFYHKSDEERKGVEIYAGVRRTRSGDLIPTGVGRLCNWTPDANGPEADEYPSFGAYQRSLTLICEAGEPGLVTWTPDKNTPDTVYYQCFTHRYLGWKIRVVDQCDEEEPQESRISNERKKVEKIINTKTNYNDFSSDKDADVLTGETHGARPEYSTVVSRGQMRDVIEAVESLETRMRDHARNQTRHVQHFYPQQQQQKPLDQQKQPNSPHMYQVHEDPESQPERPIREGDEYVVQQQRVPESYFLPPAPPPNTPPPSGPQPNNQGHTFPLPMPAHHPPHQMQKKPYGKPMFNRPPQPGNRQPIPPMKAMPPLPHTKYQFAPQKPIVKQPVVPVQNIIMGKPSPGKAPPQSQTLSLGRTDIIASHVVKSQITLPGVGDSASSASVQQSYINQPGQIILGKPMDHPVPLDQQMTQTQMHIISAPIATPPPQPKTTTQSHRHQVQQDQQTHPQYNEIKSSDFIGESTEPPVMQPAVNTGFKPNTIVVESGFKPIIREPIVDRLMDRNYNEDDDDHKGSNRREDTDVEEDYIDSPQPITNHVFHTPSEKLTESFEPMFIPSPPDTMLPTNDRTKEVFPANHAKEDRPHPVYVKTESELNALFSKKNMEKEVPSDMVMESDRVSPQYLPPDPKLPKEQSQKLAANEQTFTTYDGKIVSADTLTSVPDSKLNVKLFSSKLPARTELLLKTPQFGPFKGEIPPPIPGSIPSLKLPEPNTHLKLVNAISNKTLDELIAEGSEQHEVKVEKNKNKSAQIKNNYIKGEKGDFIYKHTSDKTVSRRRRDAIDTEVKDEKRDAQKGRPLVIEERDTKQIEFDKTGTSLATRSAWTKLLLAPLLLQLF